MMEWADRVMRESEGHAIEALADQNTEGLVDQDMTALGDPVSGASVVLHTMEWADRVIRGSEEHAIEV